MLAVNFKVPAPLVAAGALPHPVAPHRHFRSHSMRCTRLLGCPRTQSSAPIDREKLTPLSLSLFLFIPLFLCFYPPL